MNGDIKRLIRNGNELVSSLECLFPIVPVQAHIHTHYTPVPLYNNEVLVAVVVVVEVSLLNIIDAIVVALFNNSKGSPDVNRLMISCKLK